MGAHTGSNAPGPVSNRSPPHCEQAERGMHTGALQVHWGLYRLSKSALAPGLAWCGSPFRCSLVLVMGGEAGPCSPRKADMLSCHAPTAVGWMHSHLSSSSTELQRPTTT